MTLDLVSHISQLTECVNGQYPRPWVSDYENPLNARVFIVGRNQATPFPCAYLSHERFLNALFNRSSESCRRLYLEIRAKEGKGPSQTRSHYDFLLGELAAVSINDVLETNVVCYSTPMAGDLRRIEHKEGVLRGREIFGFLIAHLKPQVLIFHGSGTVRDASRQLKVKLPKPTIPLVRTAELELRQGRTVAFIIPSLAPPAWNQWRSSAPLLLAQLAKDVRGALDH